MTKREKLPTIKFWTTIHGSPVRLCIPNGCSGEWYHSERTDEGYRTEWRNWYAQDGIIVGQTEVRERDCDGVFTRYDEYGFLRGEAATGYYDDEHGITFPEWKLLTANQRDLSAEAANY